MLQQLEMRSQTQLWTDERSEWIIQSPSGLTHLHQGCIWEGTTGDQCGDLPVVGVEAGGALLVPTPGVVEVPLPGDTGDLPLQGEAGGAVHLHVTGAADLQCTGGAPPLLAGVETIVDRRGKSFQDLPGGVSRGGEGSVADWICLECIY